ncbi:MAG: hypothetical protein AAF725_04720 [Acidobacteriota bacterium]
MAASAGAQMVTPPQTLWGDVSQAPEGLQVGSIEILAALVLALGLVLASSVFLGLRNRRLSACVGHVLPVDAPQLERDLRRTRIALGLCLYILVPSLCVATLAMAGQRSLLGVEISLLATGLSLASLLCGGAALMAPSRAQRPAAGALGDQMPSHSRS